MSDVDKEPMATRSPEKFYLDEVERLHDAHDKLLERIVRVEDKLRGSGGGDPMADVMLWMAIAYAVSLLVPPLISLWRGNACDRQL